VDGCADRRRHAADYQENRMVKKPVNEKHHWWPQSVSKFWADRDGRVTRISCDGKLIPSFPKSFGAVRNDNNIVLGKEPTVWDESFEDTFAHADSNFPKIVRWLQQLTCNVPANQDHPFAKRLAPLILQNEMHALLAECLASLIARSPSFRHRIDLSIGYFRQRIGFEEPVEKSLIGLNARDAQRVLSKALVSGGKYAVLFSGNGEFIFGDGFLHNISSVANAPWSPRSLIPITPNIAVFYTRPISYRTYPKAFTLNLTDQEVAFVNSTVQVYSKRFIFFRTIRPIIDSEFERCEHLQLEYDNHAWIEALGHAMAETFYGGDAEFYTP